MPRRILALDTATPSVTAGIVTDALEVLAERITVDARAHAERLTPNVLGALTDAGLTMADLDAVVVGCGPGPFTGLRVGMATAAAYGHALGIPVYGVCSLDAIGGQTTGETLVVTDARRREIYWARYRAGVRVDGPAVNAPADVNPGAAREVAGSPEHAALFDLPRCEPTHPTPAGLVAAVDWSDEPAPLVPLYLRRPDAKPAAERSVVFGPLTPADAKRCAELEALLFPGDDPWPKAAFIRELAAKHNHYVAARIGDLLLGYGGISRLGRTPPFEYEVHTIGVDPGYQGRGIGRRLLGELLDFADGGVVHLEVRTDNAAAIALYRSVGFTDVGLRRRYYRISGADAYTMRRDPA
ncbi:ribosomal-protein-alanine acetyltransferase [Mycobacterium kyorinense]|uniref:Ribosomal-protein-alanine acetyltransferase n=1 Tax=Mycobacterium kyorinense TaxID=487514 RepID=A0A1A2ZTK0_9MYCO|nr:ribosomal-protein-alanine acetyltransferase [Mycobacterium kyorinense]